MTEARVSECCVEYRFGDAIDPETSRRVLRAYRTLKTAPERAALMLRDILPTYTTLAVHFEPQSPLLRDTAPLRHLVDAALLADDDETADEHIIDVRYDGEDLPEVSARTGLEPSEVIARHTARSYTIAMLGFRPYFPYFLGLDPALVLPRRETPRMSLPKGSVAIAAGQTGIYPQSSPGGWHIIGHTDFDAYESLRPGDRITFRSLPC